VAKQVPVNIGFGGSHLDTQLQGILAGLAVDSMLAHVKMTAVTGASAGSDITLDGISTDDKILFAVIVHDMAAATPSFSSVDIAQTSELHVDDDDVIHCSVDTTDCEVFVLWVDKSTAQVN